MDGLDPSNVGNTVWDYFLDSQGDSLNFNQFNEEDPFTISFWIKTSQTADSMFTSSRDANGVALGKIDEKFALIYIQEGGDSDASDGVPGGSFFYHINHRRSSGTTWHMSMMATARVRSGLMV
jgi:hypothetical protein